VPEIEYLSSLKDMQRGGLYGRRWTLLMVAGGHFAGIVVQVRQPDEDDVAEPTVEKKKKKQRPKPEVHIIKHKTFHRYTSQSPLYSGKHVFIHSQHAENRAVPNL
jgi:hypothetical protein